MQDIVDVRDEIQRMRTDADTRGQIAENRTKAQPLKYRHRNDRGRKKNDCLIKFAHGEIMPYSLWAVPHE